MPRKPSKPKTTRRGKNEGSVYRRKDGKWVGQVTVGYHPDTGKPIRKYTYANTREEAAHWIALTLVSETSKAAPSLASELLLKDFLHRWLTTFKTYEVCSRTMELYYSCERLHIIPALGDIPVAALTASRIQTFLYYLQAEKQLSRRTTSLVRSILIQLYDYAVEMSLAPINPARSTEGSYHAPHHYYAAAVDTASQQLMDGTYTPKRSAEAVRAQLQQIDPMLSEDMTVNLKYL